MNHLLSSNNNLYNLFIEFLSSKTVGVARDFAVNFQLSQPNGSL
jgi:hypothetical protein